jgi:hypothetical protein
VSKQLGISRVVLSSMELAYSIPFETNSKNKSTVWLTLRKAPEVYGQRPSWRTAGLPTNAPFKDNFLVTRLGSGFPSNATLLQN